MKEKIETKNKWFKLDNAAKIYPAKIGKKDSCVYRISANMVNEIIPETLEQAVKDCKLRFPSMYVKMKKGLFWYYFEPNEKLPIVKREDPYINQLIDVTKNNDYQFTVFYYRNRISLECFHSLCDGTGAMEFLKAIIFRYLILLGHDINDEGMILKIDEMPKDEEIEDSFKKYYSNSKDKLKKEESAYQIRDLHLPDYSGVGVINGRFKTDELLALAKKEEATLTEYLAALLSYCIWQVYEKDNIAKKPISICIPVNIRKFFNSKTLRNFSLFFYTSINCKKEELTLNEILSKTKSDFKSEITKEKLQQNLNANVAMERNIAIRFCPLFIKNIIMKIAANVLGDSLNTCTLSNLGNIILPSSMSSFIKDFEFILTCNNLKTNSMSMVSVNGTTTISFSRSIYETKIEKLFFSYLANMGIDAVIDSNYLEEYV
jgi:NRPS condensation-like uncharacterized protein